MSGVILESEGPFNRRKKTCTLYPVIYGSEVLVCGLKVSHASPGFSPQREETEIGNRPTCLSFEEARAEEESKESHGRDFNYNINMPCKLRKGEYMWTRACSAVFHFDCS